MQIGHWKADLNCGRHDLGPRNEDEPAAEQKATEVVRKSDGIQKEKDGVEADINEELHRMERN